MMTQRTDVGKEEFFLDLKRLNPKTLFYQKEGSICTNCRLNRLGELKLPNYCIIRSNPQMAVKSGFIAVDYAGKYGAIYGENCWPGHYQVEH